MLYAVQNRNAVHAVYHLLNTAPEPSSCTTMLRVHTT